MMPLSPFLLSHPFARPVPTRSRGPHMVSRPGRGAAAGGGAAPPPSFPLPRRGSSSLLPAPPGASPPPSATLRRPLVPALPARVARASSGELPSTRARASSGELLSRRLPPASARRSPPQALPPSSRRALYPRRRRPPPRRCSPGPRGRLLVAVPQATVALHRPALDLSCLGSMRAARPARALAWDLSEKGVRGGRATRRRRFLADVPGSGVCSMDEQPGGGVSEHLDGRADPRGSHSPPACPRRRLPGPAAPLLSPSSHPRPWPSSYPRPPTELHPRPLCSSRRRRCFFGPAEQPANEFSRACV